MKALLFCGLIFTSTFAFAAPVPVPEGELTIDDAIPKQTSNRASNLSEFGLEYTSINNGSMFADVDFVREWDRGFGVGIRGYLPMEYNNQNQAFMAQVFGRVILINEEDQMFLDLGLTGAVYNQTATNNSSSSTTNFMMLGAAVGYSHKITKQMRVGANLGVDYSNGRISHDNYFDQSVIYNKIGLNGTYYF